MIHVLVVDDSAVVREVMIGILEQEPDLRVTTAADPIIAMSRMRLGRPDVIVLDLEMPRMDGITFLRRLMAVDPIPVVVCSAAAGRGTETAVRAMEEGAVAVMGKPMLGVRQFLHESALMLIDTVRGAAAARLRRTRQEPPLGAARPAGDARAERRLSRASPREERLVAMGASVGGTEALRAILTAMPADAPAIAVVQHMPEGFTRAFAERLDGLCCIQVKEAADGDPLSPGSALIAPGNRHLRVCRSGRGYHVALDDGPLVSRHRPSLDVLFRSVAEQAGPHAVGVVLTGMGDDGARGLDEMRRAGAATLAQDEASSVVFGMPREAIARGAAQVVIPLQGMATAILHACGRPAPEPVSS